jgi:hypothetical protein
MQWWSSSLLSKCYCADRTVYLETVSRTLNRYHFQLGVCLPMRRYCRITRISLLLFIPISTYFGWPLQVAVCPADNATAGSLGRRRAGQLRFGFVAVSAGHIVYLTARAADYVSLPSQPTILTGPSVFGKQRSCDLAKQKPAN